MPFHSQDSNTGGASNHSLSDGLVSKDLEPSPEKPVTSARTPTERKRKRKTTAGSAAVGTTAGGILGSGPVDPSPGGLPGTPDGGHKSAAAAKPISEYFPKRAPASPVRGGTKSPLSFGTNPPPGMYPQSPKPQYVASPVVSSNSSNGPPMAYERLGGDYGLLGSRPGRSVQTDLTSAEMTKKTVDSEAKDGRIDELTRLNDEVTRHLTTRNKEVEASKNTISKCLSVVKELLVEKSRIERKDARAKCMQNRLRLGQFVTQRVGATFQENWTDGYAFQELSKRQEEIANEREEIDKKKKLLAKRKPSDSNGTGSRKRSNAGTLGNPANSSTNSNTTTGTGTSTGSGVGSGSDSPGSVSMNRDGNSQGSNPGPSGALHNGSVEETMFTKPPPRDGMTMQEYYEAEEILKLRYASLRKEDTDLQLEMEKLERNRNLHIRELKRIHNEDQSR
jgi:tousled-like kinase